VDSEGTGVKDRIKYTILATALVIAVLLLVKGLIFGLKPTAIFVIAALLIVVYLIKPRSTK